MRTQSVYYVYSLKDPRVSPARAFYIGKGTGTRAWEHELRIDGSIKGKRVQEIQDAGLDVLTEVLVDGLSEVEALRIEAQLIGAFGVVDRGGLLTNVVVPSGRIGTNRKDIVVPEGCVEKAQMALDLLKASVLELTRANKDGLTNYDVAKCLGLQSDYGGGSKNYLSYSVLGILMRDGRVRRLENRKHIALIK